MAWHQFTFLNIQVTRLLHSSSQNFLAVPRSRLKTYGDRAFSIVVPKLWNQLPPEFRGVTAKHTYKILLQRSADDLYIPLWCITILGKHMDISGSTELLYVSKIGSLFTNQRASKFGREREVNFHLHLKYHSKQVQSSSNKRREFLSY